MAKQDFVPAGDLEFIPWAQAFSTGITTSGAAVGLAPAEITAAQGEIAVTVPG